MKYFLLPLFVFVFSGVKSETLDTIHKTITAIQADSLIDANAGNPDFYIIDVRTPSEFSGGHILNALNINYYGSTFQQDIAALDSTKTYLLYCASGSRSTLAYNYMVGQGFLHLYNMSGGISSWIANGFPTYTGSVGIESAETENAGVYPNPATSFVCITNGNSPFSVSLFDMTGRLVLNCNLQNERLDISSVEKGFYNIVIVSNEGTVTKERLLIVR